ncbi:aspartate-alanine antiporter [Azospirillum sp. CT11-132]|uniref:aspartate-alanine antiporter n=1 Tax=Azospirillum sp. CT11-132 TaxID=3396317 RepID=UPI0039A710F9
MDWVGNLLRHHPDLAVFLVLGLGYWIGNFRLGLITLGPVSGALFAGLLIGQFRIPVSDTARSLLFLLFLFGNGYAVGPQFFQSLRGDGPKALVLTVIQCSVALAVTILLSKLLGLDPGMAAGLLTGSLTQSSALGAAVEAIKDLPLTEAERQLMSARVAIGDALTYMFGTLGAILFVSQIGPRLLGIDPQQEAQRLDAELGVKNKPPGMMNAYTTFIARAFRLDRPEFAGHTVSDLETQAPKRVMINRIRRGDNIINAAPDTALAQGDVLTLTGRRASVMEVGPSLGLETDDPEVLDFPVIQARLIITSAWAEGKTLQELSEVPETRGVFVRRIMRLGQSIPILPETRVNRGDQFEIVGGEPEVKRAGQKLGRVESETLTTDMKAVGLAIALGAIVGLPQLIVGPLHIGLGTSVGALLAGVIVGWLHSRHPGFGQVPPAALDLMRVAGLAAFVGMVGMQAGPHFISALLEYGVAVVLGGAVCTLVPLLVGTLVGRYVLGLSPLLTLGAVAGAQTSTPALAALQDRCGSPVAVLGYTVPYAIGQILLTVWGSVIVGILT